jgi:hypothetical protein
MYVVLKANDPRLRGERAALFVIASVLLELRALFGSEINDYRRLDWAETVAGGDLRVVARVGMKTSVLACRP